MVNEAVPSDLSRCSQCVWLRRLNVDEVNIRSIGTKNTVPFNEIIHSASPVRFVRLEETSTETRSTDYTLIRLSFESLGTRMDDKFIQKSLDDSSPLFRRSGKANTFRTGTQGPRAWGFVVSGMFRVILKWTAYHPSTPPNDRN